MATPSQLPPGWLVRVSRSKGKVYYYHSATNKTQWTRPTAEDSVDDEVEAEDSNRKRRRVEEQQQITAVNQKDEMLHTLIVASMRVGGSSVTRGTKRSVVFTPWPHQLAAVEKIIKAIQKSPMSDDANKDRNEAIQAERFLLQHSTGAGKSLTIAALTHQLLYVKDVRAMQFHTVVVMLDRVKLNEQVGDAVERYLRQNGVDEVFRAESIEHLAKLLDASSQSEQQKPQRVIITTTHKLGLLVRNDVLLTRLLHRRSTKSRRGAGHEGGDRIDANGADPYQRVAIITDEAHRSHTTSTRDAIEKVMKAGEGCHTRLTFIGFTATPNAEALELFGSRADNGFQVPFHCYPIADATIDGRVMNVLADYTCVRCEIETSVFPEPVQKLLRTTYGAQRRILDHANDDVAVLKAKALLMMTDFQVMKNAHPNVKCMIVVRSRLDVVRYYKLITTFVTKKQLGWNCYAAFSGTLALDDGAENTKSVTEQTLNRHHVTLSISDIVIVCDKLDTGYNEPLLACMYVDRYLRSSAHIVQLLSRLNRRHKSKPCVRVLDFANHAAQVRRGFTDFWQEAKVPCATDTIDEMAEQLNLITAVVILCDFFPALCASPVTVKSARAFVLDYVLPLDRDAFQQVTDALRGAVLARKRLDMAGFTDVFNIISPFSYDLLTELKKETESHIVAVEASAELSLDEIKGKMSARVHHYHRSFSGQLYPQSLLDRLNCGMELSKVVPRLLQFGVLEQCEAFFFLHAARNRHQHLESSIATQVVRAAQKVPNLPGLKTIDGEDRMSARLVGMGEELSCSMAG